MVSLENALVDPDNPWPGLESYRESDQPFFHGREREAQGLLRLVMRERLTVFFGVSGLGKTSLLQAGLFPKLRLQSVFPILIRLGFSSDQSSLKAQVMHAIQAEAAGFGVEAPLLRVSETLWENFHRLDNYFWSGRNRLLMPLLVFDQFEEIFTLGQSSLALQQTCKTFLVELGDLIEGRPPNALKESLDNNPQNASQFIFHKHHYKILLSLREDFLPALEELRESIPSLARNRMRLRPMNGNSAFDVVSHPQHLIDAQVAEKVVRFVAASKEPEIPLEKLELEPAILSVVCRELNLKRQRRKEHKITEQLLAGSHTEILCDFYEQSLKDFVPEVRIFIEDYLLTVSGYRDSVALENALSQPGVTREILDRLIDRRLLRLEEQAGMSRLELTHDVLAAVVSISREKRRQVEVEESRKKEMLAIEKQKLLEERAKSARRLLWLTAGLVILLILVVFFSKVAWDEKQLAEIQREKAEQAREVASAQSREAEIQKEKAEQAMKFASEQMVRLEESVQLRQALLSRSKESREMILKKLSRDEQIKFGVTAREKPYRARNGQPTYQFKMFPHEQSVSGGFEAIALITYMMDHPTFLNPLILAGPDTKFTGTYDGTGCLAQVTAVIEYSNLDKPVAYAEFPMCQLTEYIRLK